MINIAISQRVEIIDEINERRDALDQKWAQLLFECGLKIFPIPNTPELFDSYINDLDIKGVILTGGNDLVSLGGDSPERDETERQLLEYAREQGLPLLGVCRGMQLIQETFNVELKKVKGHVTSHQEIIINEVSQVVNSYHNYGSYETVESLEVWAKSKDGVIKAIRHCNESILGIMWHPERFKSFRNEDIDMISNFFETSHK